MQDVYVGKKNPIGIQHTQKSDDYTDADVVEIDSDGKYIVIHPKPHEQKYPNSTYRMQGTFILDKKVIAYIPDGKPFNVGNELLSKLLEAGENFYAYESDEEVIWIDTPEKWREVEAYLKKRAL